MTPRQQKAAAKAEARAIERELSDIAAMPHVRILRSSRTTYIQRAVAAPNPRKPWHPFRRPS
jgi:hypothetical protein